jgi:xanthine dehydrogenase molybdenum-binding subunit
LNVNFTLNDKRCSVDLNEGETLLDTLRFKCQVTSPKNGCQPQGQCGCCLVLIDGKPIVSCAFPSHRIEGKSVQTLEGLTESDRDLLSHAFGSAAGLQCGFCIPGIALRANALIKKNPTPSRQEIAKAIDVHLCRCTGYKKIVDAIDLYAKAKQGQPLPTPMLDGGVGDRLVRYQTKERVLGDGPYVDDLEFDGMIHGAVVLSPHARARVLSMDTSAAENAEGVVRVATSADVPGERWYGLIHKDWPGFVAVGEEVRCVGDILAVVVAETAYLAQKAASLVQVEYELLTPVLDPEEAIQPGAPQVNPNRADNKLSETVIRRGDIENALNNSAHVVEGIWHTQRIEHLYLEPESAVARIREDGRLHLYTQGQGIFEDQRQICNFLALEEDELFVELVPNGGAFGGKEDMAIQAHAALMTRLTGRPVKITLNREESIRISPKRHPIKMHYKVGADAEGHLTAIWARLIGDTGAYASVGEKVLERAAGHACGPYRVPAVDIESIAAYTNNPPCGAMRGFGVNQTSFAIEGCMDQLADKVGIDGWEIRWRNAVTVGDLFSTGQVFEKSIGIKKTLEAVKEDYYKAKNDGKAVGVGCGLKNTGLGNGAVEWGRARMVPESDGTVSIYNGFTEMGQGLLTILTQFAREVTGLPASIFRPKVDATFVLSCGQTTGSRATLLSGLAVKEASERLKSAMDNAGSLEAIVGQVYAGDACIDDTTKPGADVDKVKTHTSFGFATQVVILDETGRLERVIAAHDVGRAINPDLCEGQIEGSVHMGLGYALTEELPCEAGMPVTFKLRDIGALRARDMPEVDVILIEEHEPEGPFGAKGVGEIGLVPTAGAVAGALYQFDGLRRNTLPMKDSPTAKAITVGKIRGGGNRENWH